MTSYFSFLMFLFVFTGAQAQPPVNQMDLTVGSQSGTGASSTSQYQQNSGSAGDVNSRIGAQQESSRRETAQWKNLQRQQELIQKQIEKNLEDQRLQKLSSREKDYLTEVQKYLLSHDDKDLPISLKTGDPNVRRQLGDIYAGLYSVTPKNDAERDLRSAGFGLVRSADNHFASAQKEGGIADSKMALEILSILVGFIPVVGEAQCIYIAWSGIDPVTGDKVGPWARGFAVAGVLTAGYGYKFSEGMTVYSKIMGGLARSETEMIQVGKIATDANEIISVTMRGEDPKIMADILESAKDLERHQLFNPGELHSLDVSGGGGTIAETFRGGSYVSYTNTKPIDAYRLYDATKAEAHAGSFWSRVRPTGTLRTRMENDIDVAWNSGHYWAKAKIPPGQLVFEGVSSGTVKAGHRMSQFSGSADQIYIKVKPEWIEQTGQIGREPAP